MGKPNKKANANQVAGSEGFQRLNFLFQASHAVIENAPKCAQLTSVYGNHMVSICKKLQLKMDPSIKRTLCKGCKGLLIPGHTASVEIKYINRPKKVAGRKKKSSQKTQVWTCLQCHHIRNFPLNADFVLWSEKCKE